jgi:hypothetical protein
MAEKDIGPRDRGQRDLVDLLRDLAVLRDQGVLSESEFQREKVKALAEYQQPDRIRPT